MFSLKSLTGRIFFGKIIGLCMGIAYLVFLPTAGVAAISMHGAGALMLFMFMGVLIGFIGQFDRHPVLDFAMPWWFRGSVVGASMMLMFVFLTYDTLVVLMQSPLVTWTGLSSPFWILIDGTIIGLLMSFVETKFAGSGENLPVT